MDDVKPQSFRLRLSVHFVAILLMFNQLGLYQTPWYFTLIALIFCTGVLNAYNFMDGINGITRVDTVWWLWVLCGQRLDLFCADVFIGL